MRRASIFISYRRDDSAGYARAVYDELASRFGAERVFIDVDDIGAGQAFGDVIERAVGASLVLLVLIGRRWRGEREGGTPRIGDAGDFVAREVAAGLAKGMRVIPVLLDGATMPTAAELPEALRPLAGRNALEVDNTRFAADMARLVAALGETLGEAPKPPAATRAPKPWKWIGGSLVAALVVAAALVLWQRAAAPPAANAVAGADIDGAWQADLTYDWPNSHFVERFVFSTESGALHGTASFLSVPRGILEAGVDANGLRFVTRTSEAIGDAVSETVHRYNGRLVNGEIRFVMQSEGGSSPHAPVSFVARRVVAAASQAGR